MERRVRELRLVGRNSLAVTLPREWAEKLGLKKGDPAIMFLDAASRSIVMWFPESWPPTALPEIEVNGDELSWLPPDCLPVCFYVAQVRQARIRFSSAEKARELLRSLGTSPLATILGADAWDEADGRGASVVISLESALSSLPGMRIEMIAWNVRRLFFEFVERYREALERGPTSEYQVARANLYKHIFNMIRLNTGLMMREGHWLFLVGIAVSYVGAMAYMLDMLLEPARRIPELRRSIEQALDVLTRLGDLAARAIRSGSLAHIRELYETVEKMTEEALRAAEPGGLVRVLILLAFRNLVRVLVCYSILVKASRSGS